MSYSHSIRMSVLAATAAVVLSMNTAGAASQCKGLVENVCSADTQCTWVDGYMRKDGRAVSAHCRKAPRSSASTKKVLEPTRKGQLDG